MGDSSAGFGSCGSAVADRAADSTGESYNPRASSLSPTLMFRSSINPQVVAIKAALVLVLLCAQVCVYISDVSPVLTLGFPQRTSGDIRSKNKKRE